MGTIMVILASFVSVCGVNLQKMAHNRNQALPREARKPMGKDWLWWCGMVLMFGGSLLDLIALPFVPQSRVSALGAAGIVANVVITPLFLKERPTRYDLIGCLICTAGCTVATLFGASNEPDLTSDCLLSYFKASPFVVYISVITLLLCTLMYFIEGFRRKKNAVIAAGVTDVFETRWVADNWDKVAAITDYPGSEWFIFLHRGPQFYPSVHAGLAGMAGAQSIMLAKAVLIFLGNIISGPDNAKSAGLLVAFLLPFGLCLWLQIAYLNIALKIYPDALFVLPVYQSFWIVFGIASGLIYYQEYLELSGTQTAMFSAGVLLSLAGVAVLAQRKSKPKRPAALLQADVDPEVLVRDGESAERLSEGSSKTSMLSELDHPIARLESIAWFSEFVLPNYSVPTNVEDDLIHPNGRRSSRSLTVPKVKKIQPLTTEVGEHDAADGHYSKSFA